MLEERRGYIRAVKPGVASQMVDLTVSEDLDDLTNADDQRQTRGDHVQRRHDAVSDSVCELVRFGRAASALETVLTGDRKSGQVGVTTLADVFGLIQKSRSARNDSPGTVFGQDQENSEQVCQERQPWRQYPSGSDIPMFLAAWTCGSHEVRERSDAAPTESWLNNARLGTSTKDVTLSTLQCHQHVNS